MKLHLWIAFAIVMVLFTSCNSFSQPTTDSTFPEVTQTPPDIIVTTPATATPLEPETITVKPPTSTQTAELPIPTSTPTVTNMPEGPIRTPALTPTKKMVLKPSATQALLDVQIGSPVGVPNFAHPNLGCQWMGLAGQIFDINNIPIKDFVVEVGGTLSGQQVFGLAIAGQAQAYGPGGYEISLGNEPVASSGTAWAQVLDLDGNPVSSPTYFSTYAECEKNLILLNFVQSYEPPSEWIYLPVIMNGRSTP